MGSLTDPPFGRIAIVGLGLIGGSIALAARRRWPAITVVAVDRSAVIETALTMRAIDDGGEDLRVAERADLVVLAAPVLQNVDALRRLPDHLDRRAVVTDVSSTKRAISDAAAEVALTFIGGHPLAGAAVSGLEAARPDLFDDRPWILTGADRAPDEAGAALAQFVVAMRSVPVRMDAAEHDRLLAYISHLPQLAVSALMHVVGGRVGADGLALAGRGLRDTTRLATSPAPTWRDIVATNGDNISTALDDLIAALQQLKPHVADPPSVVDDVFLSAAKWKGVLEHG
ncbi:MAG: prephenate dehydrogenase [Vicinamibacterales bacterium]